MGEVKTCEHCGESFNKNPKVSWKLWERQRFCSQRCAGIALNPRKASAESESRYRKIHTPDGRVISEHRWVVEQRIGRPLEVWEQVHHKNENKHDNRDENLEIVTAAEHGQRHTKLPTEKVCEVCGAEYTPHKTKRRRAKTCSWECRNALISLKRKAVA